MFALTNKPDMGARLYKDIIALATDKNRGTDTMMVVQHMAGVLVETYLVFEKPDEAMMAGLSKLSHLLETEPLKGDLDVNALPPANIIDQETERGRMAARQLFEDWLDCAYEFHELILTIIHNIIISWEEDGQSREETLRLLAECAMRCMVFEIAAQELCDVVIEEKVAGEGWQLQDCIASLSAVSGRRLAISLNAEFCEIFSGVEIPENLDSIAYVMTQEAVRLGVPAGSDWRFGLPANDVPVNAPIDLIFGIEPFCSAFFEALNIDDPYFQSICCAKAAGRMVAVASGGEIPEIEPAIAKPLAMLAMSETYKSVCMMHDVTTY
ncbi:MAG: hypothetical protein AB8B83_02360 [Bdellovibrionales bacterium]